MRAAKHRTHMSRICELPVRRLFHHCGLRPGKSGPSFNSCLTGYLPILLTLLFMTLLCFAQEAQRSLTPPGRSTQAEEVGAGEIVRVDTDLVPVEVNVRDTAGRVVRGLRKGDFKLFEDGIERPISFFSVGSMRGGIPRTINVVFALDVSGSMTRNEMELLRNTAAVFQGSLSEPGSRFAVISFGMKVKLLQSLTGDQRKIDKALDYAVRDQMGLSTHAYDAVDDAVRLLAREGGKASDGRVVKRVVILISDGFPTGDIVSPRTVIERANAANVSIYTVTIPSFSFNYTSVYGQPLPTILDVSGLVKETGGVSVYATDKNYTVALQAITEEVLFRYVLAYRPSPEKLRDGNFHRIRIEALNYLKVNQSRRGYAGKGPP
jgi:Ca-activated chloride channel homolog